MRVTPARSLRLSSTPHTLLLRGTSRVRHNALDARDHPIVSAEKRDEPHATKDTEFLCAPVMLVAERDGQKRLYVGYVNYMKTILSNPVEITSRRLIDAWRTMKVLDSARFIDAYSATLAFLSVTNNDQTAAANTAMAKRYASKESHTHTHRFVMKETPSKDDVETMLGALRKAEFKPADINIYQPTLKVQETLRPLRPFHKRIVSWAHFRRLQA